jgi:hypothetical protein
MHENSCYFLFLKIFWQQEPETLRPESSENIPILLQEADLYLSNQNDLRNPKMGSKHTVVGATQQ